MNKGTFSTDRRSVSRLLRGFNVGVVLVFCFLIFSFWRFQVGQHAHFLEMAENNHQRTVNLRSPRGVVFDRDGQVLIDNRYSLNISLIREQVGDLSAVLELLADVTTVDVGTLREVVESNSHIPGYRSLVLIRDASLEQVAGVSARALELPGVFVEQIPTRYYPNNNTASHLFGYLGEVTSAQLNQLTDGRLRSGSVIGQAGLELFYNRPLMGIDGTRKVAVNSIGREIETIDEVAPTEGQPLQLTLDLDLQRAAEEIFESGGYSGAAVVLDPTSGEVLALSSMPSYDPNDFALGVDEQTWKNLNGNSLKPLQNRALQGRYSPGSTFKIVMAAAALDEQIIDPEFTVNCGGGGNFYGRFFGCHARHGTVNLYEALEQSCNTYFYKLGTMVDVDTINRWASAFGLGESSGLDLPHEVIGLVPSRAWKREVKGEPWYPGETISVAIGQGAVAVTPMSLAIMISTVANGGERVTPYLFKRKTKGSDSTIIGRQTLDAIREGLWMVVNRNGTGGRSRIQGYDIIGKTGTAQVISLEGRELIDGSDEEYRDHGLFVFAAPLDSPRIAGVVVAEHAEHGYIAAEMARHILEVFFAKEEGRPIPNLQSPVLPAENALEMPSVVAEGQ